MFLHLFSCVGFSASMTHFAQYQKAPENSPGAFSSASSSLFYLACAVPKTAKKKQEAIPDDGKQFIVCDFSAIEARVIAWLAGESWRQEAFHDGCNRLTLRKRL